MVSEADQRQAQRRALVLFVRVMVMIPLLVPGCNCRWARALSQGSGCRVNAAEGHQMLLAVGRQALSAGIEEKGGVVVGVMDGFSQSARGSTSGRPRGWREGARRDIVTIPACSSYPAPGSEVWARGRGRVRKRPQPHRKLQFHGGSHAVILHEDGGASMEQCHFPDGAARTSRRYGVCGQLPDQDQYHERR